MKKRFHKIAYSAIVVAVAVSLGFALVPVPNIELVTLTLFLGGYLLGFSHGMLSGGLAWLIYSMFNPFGMAPLPLMISQIFSGIIIGAGGAVCKGIFDKIQNRMILIISSVFAGCLLTIIFQILINIGAFITFGTDQTFFVFVIGGLSFGIMHIVANSVIFGVLVPILISLPLVRKR